MSKKLSTVFSLILLVSMLLTACNAAATTAPTVAPTGAPVTGQEVPTDTSAPIPPAQAGYLTISNQLNATWVRNFNPFSPNALAPAQTEMYEPLMIYNKATNKLVPWLATDYSWSSDNTSLTFKIRQGVLWSDGQPFTAKDVIYTFNLLKNNSALAGTASSVLNEYIDSFTAPDDQTVVLKFKTVYTPALYDLSAQSIVPEHIWKDVKDPLTWTNDNPVGTGPFTEVSKFDAQIFTVDKNPHYWQPDKPAFQGLRFPAWPGNDQANMALTNGDVDWAGNFIPDIDKTWVSKNSSDFHYYFVGAAAVLLYINSSLKPFDNPDVRKAISMGIDRKMIVSVAEYDYIPPSDATGLGDSYKAWKDPAAVSAGTWTNYDIKAANDALDKAGLTKGSDGIRVYNGKPMVYDLIAVSGWTDWISACQIVAQNMKDLGITINVKTPEYDAWYDELSKGNHQWAIGWSSTGPSPYNFYRGLMSKITSQPVGQSANENWNRFVDPDADALLETFAQTSDAAKQKDLMNQLQAIFVKDAPVLPLFPGPDWYEYVTTRFTGFPTKDNPYAPGTPFNDGSNITPLLVLTSIKPK